MASRELSSLELTKAYLHRIKELESAPRRGHRDQPAGDRDRGPARRRTATPSRARSAPRHPGPGQGQHRDRRPDGDDRRFAGAASAAASRPMPTLVASPSARRRRHPRQGEPLGMGQLPRVHPGRFPERLERPRRVHPQPVRARLGPVRVELRIGRRRRREPLLGDGRVGDRRLDPLSGRATTASSGSSRRSAWSPQTGIIPIAHSQDTAGPMTRTVTDAAIMLNAHARTVRAGARSPVCRPTTRPSCSAERSTERSIGVDRLNFQEEYFAVPELNEVTERALDVMAVAGRHHRRHRDRGLPRSERLVRPRVHGPAERVQARRGRLHVDGCATRGCARSPT